MSELNEMSQDDPDTLPETDSAAMPPSGLSVGGGKTMTVFGALFGAAAAVPT